MTSGSFDRQNSGTPARRHPGARARRAGLVCAAAIAAFFGAIVTAQAAPTVAIPCEDDPLYCAWAPLSYDKVDALPVEWSFDTGWVPSGSDVQVHLWAGVYANTRVGLSGRLINSWAPESPGRLDLMTPGTPNGASLSFHYGAEVGAQGKVHIEVLGQSYDWVGDLPYVPQFDFQVEAKEQFDAWAFPPGHSVKGKTDEQTLAQIGIGDIIGASIPGIDGGFELNAAMELVATYTTHEIVLETNGEAVAGGPILSEDGASYSKPIGGAFTDIDVHPEGTVGYDGVLHLIPAFYVELLGNTWSIPVADIPIAFPITETDWSFDPVSVHVPFPDIKIPVKELDFGELEVGQKNLEILPLDNAGEALLAVSMFSDNDAFEVFTPELDVAPGKSVDAAFRFVPSKTGHFETTILIYTNDPDAPTELLVLKGEGVDGPPLVIDTDEVEVEEGAQDVGACACSVPGASTKGPDGAPARSGSAAFVPMAVAAFIAGWRRTRSRRSKRG